MRRQRPLILLFLYKIEQIQQEVGWSSPARRAGGPGGPRRRAGVSGDSALRAGRDETGTDRTGGVVRRPPPGRAAPAAIEVSHLTKVFGGRTAVSDVSFSVAGGEV